MNTLQTFAAILIIPFLIWLLIALVSNLGFLGFVIWCFCLVVIEKCGPQWKHYSRK